MARNPNKSRFAVVIRRYADDVAYAHWTDGKVTASRWAAHAIRTVRDLQTCYIVDHADNARQYPLVEFRRAFL